MPRSGKSQEKTKNFQDQGKVGKFAKKSGKILALVKVSEKSVNFVFMGLRSCEKCKEIENEEKNISLWSVEKAEANVKVDKFGLFAGVLVSGNPAKVYFD